MLKIGGHRVGPAEIEHVIAQHPRVVEVAVIGEPDGLKGEVAVAFVVARPDQAPDEAELRRFCQERLPAFKVPARFRWLDALPRSEAGKVLRAGLRRL
jgi:acyl-coenzyme A synthetase/AMP-(fatty) acid ligase